MAQSFRALVIDERDGTRTAGVRRLERDDLPDGDVVVDVLFSSVNYKDALAVTGRGKIIRGGYPFVPGIDLVGRVTASASEAFAAGDLVIGTGWGLGENTWGGYTEVQRIRAETLVPLPEGLAPRDAMAIGTAGFTAMLSVMALEAHGAEPGKGEVVVTGASGGVGSMAVALLARRGFEVVASTGTAAAHEYLTALGASRIIGRDDLGAGPRRPLDSARWQAAVDSVGGATLAAVISQLDRHGSVAACGLAGGHELAATVFPFILRGVNLLGIDSNTCPNEVRRAAWQRLTDDLTRDDLDRMVTRTVTLDELAATAEALLANEIQGRVVVDVTGP